MTASDSRNIVLTGFMGTGKTTVGRLLAEQLGYEFVDTDVVIEQRHGKIADVFRTHGRGGASGASSGSLPPNWPIASGW